jgi:hypothetical protein
VESGPPTRDHGRNCLRWAVGVRGSHRSLTLIKRAGNYRLFFCFMGSAIGVCKMCDQLKSLVKAHIIARSFFETIRGSGKYSVLVNANKPIKAAGTFFRAGPHDDSILCEECERLFSEFDNYGWQILGTPSLNDPVYDNGKPYSYKIACDTDKLRRFLLSVLWRASASKLQS